MNNNMDKNISYKIIEGFTNKIEIDEQEKQNKFLIYQIERNEQDDYEKLIKNYEDLVNVNIRNLNRILLNENNKSMIMYNFGLVLELFLKMILLKMQILNLDEIGKKSHHIFDMLRILYDKCSDLRIEELCGHIEECISQIKLSNGHKINYDAYPDFRYNHQIGNIKLIFNEIIKESDKKNIKEVLECINAVMNN